MELISKMGMVVLEARKLTATSSSSSSSSQSVPGAASASTSAMVRAKLDVWKNGEPVFIDITMRETGGGADVLLERWTLSCEPTRHSGPGGDAADSEAEGHTDLVLLVQSLYTYLRRMPLHDRMGVGIALQFRISSPNEAPRKPPFPNGQSGSPWVAVHSFRPAETSFGTVVLNVEYWRFYDPAVDTIVQQAKNRSANSLVIHSSVNDVDDGHDLSVDGAKKAANTPLQRLRSLGSPRPSPLMVNRATAMAELHLGEPALHSATEARSESIFSLDDSSSSLFSSSAPMSIGSRLRQDTSRMSSSGSEDDMGMDVMGASSFVHRASPRPSPSFSRSRLSDAGMGSMRQPSNELFGSLLGSYEESILNGRMSTTPSRPVDFVAEIGVFGQGKCKPSLKCPPHVILPCPATYYLTPQDNVPSPYVGLIDLEHGIVNSENPGLMRLPAKGMLQLIIKNPNKTVVKVFLISYDFNDMPSGTKTFLRQKSYSQTAPFGLRYAVHLKYVCTGKKRVFLHQNIRVVFSHFMPDSSEKLKVVMTEASPKYVPATSTSADTSLLVDARHGDDDSDGEQHQQKRHQQHSDLFGATPLLNRKVITSSNGASPTTVAVGFSLS